MRAIIILDIPDPTDPNPDLEDYALALQTRVDEEAGYLDNGDPVTPTNVLVTVQLGDSWATTMPHRKPGA